MLHATTPSPTRHRTLHPRPDRQAAPLLQFRTSLMSQGIENPDPATHGQQVLVLQGGAALGAYQVGVYQALDQFGIDLDWVVGTSIGAINDACNPTGSRGQTKSICGSRRSIKWEFMPSRHTSMPEMLLSGWTADDARRSRESVE